MSLLRSPQPVVACGLANSAVISLTTAKADTTSKLLESFSAENLVGQPVPILADLHLSAKADCSQTIWEVPGPRELDLASVGGGEVLCQVCLEQVV